VPYNPLANPYIINPKELPANQSAAGQVPAINVGTANQWCQSPSFTPNWSLGGAQATSPVATASVTWPDAMIPDRDLAANNALSAEKTRQTSTQSGATSAIAAINALTGGAPGIFSVTPSTGAHATAIPITIFGSGFTGATGVTISVACTALVVVNDGEITCTTAATVAAGTYNVVVTTPAGTGTLTGGFVFT
jgi:hypothetical protein